MSSSRKVDFLIIGQGLAGTCLAHILLRKNKKICIIDRDAGAKCSALAAGTFNPVVFRTFSHTWKAPVLIPFLKAFYRNVEKTLGLNLMEDIAVMKIFKSGDEKKRWIERSMDRGPGQFLDSRPVVEINGVKAPFGLGKVTQSGKIQMKTYLEASRLFFKRRGLLVDDMFDHNRIEIESGKINYQGIEAEKLIFSEGHQYKGNPYFRDLPFRETKGEVLIVRIPGFDPGVIIHNRINIVPLGNEEFWVGSTFDWEDHRLETTDKARIGLEEKLRETISLPFEVKDQWVGIRPTVKDRRPILGIHPEIPEIAVFNGMGTRGVMLAPYFAEMMSENLIGNQGLDPEVELGRFT